MYSARLVLKDFLLSGHSFSENESLQKFRFQFLNSLMLLASFFTFLNYLASALGVIYFGVFFEIATLLYVIISIYVFYLLRKNESNYFIVVLFYIISSLLLFYFVLVTRHEDEFRLIAFFLALFITYVLLGKKYGLYMAVFIVVSIAAINKTSDLKISSFAFSTFYTFFIIFTCFLYFFLNKVEDDAIEFERINSQLQKNVNKEVEQRKEQEQMLLRQCRMANMGEMLDFIAHQWRQPLMNINSILMNMDLALERKVNDEIYYENKINEVSSLTAHMSQTIEDFRGLIKAKDERIDFVLEDAIDEVLTLMKSRLKNIQINKQYKGQVSLYALRNELMQVIIILLNNAIDVLDDRKIKDKEITIGIKQLVDSTVITIEDNAGGVSLENIEDIFTPYVTTKQKNGSTGIGLYIAKIIIEHKMTGSIKAANSLIGAKFTIALNKDM